MSFETKLYLGLNVHESAMSEFVVNLNEHASIIPRGVVDSLKPSNTVMQELTERKIDLDKEAHDVKIQRTIMRVTGIGLIVLGIVMIPIFPSVLLTGLLIALGSAALLKSFQSEPELEKELKEANALSQKAIGLVAEDAFGPELVGLSETSQTLFNDTVSAYGLSKDTQRLLYARMIVDQETNN